MREAGITAEQIIGRLLFWAGAVPEGERISAGEALKEIPFSSCRALQEPEIVVESLLS